MQAQDLRMWTPHELAEYFKVDLRTIYRWIREGKLEAIKLGGGSLRISQEQLDQFLEARKTGRS
jgi:excisionase family DNA binding protein